MYNTERTTNGGDSVVTRKRNTVRITKIKFYDPFRWERDNDPFCIRTFYKQNTRNIQKLVLSSGFICSYGHNVFSEESFYFDFHTQMTINMDGEIYLLLHLY